MAAARHATERGLIDPKALIEISGEKRMDEATVPGTGSPAVQPGTAATAPVVVDAETNPPRRSPRGE